MEVPRLAGEGGTKAGRGCRTRTVHLEPRGSHFDALIQREIAAQLGEGLGPCQARLAFEVVRQVLGEGVGVLRRSGPAQVVQKPFDRISGWSLAAGEPAGGAEEGDDEPAAQRMALSCSRSWSAA